MLLLVTAGAVLAGLYRWPWWSPAALAAAGAFGAMMVVVLADAGFYAGSMWWTNKSIEPFGMYLVASYALYYLTRGIIRSGSWAVRKIRGDRSVDPETH